MPDQTDIAVRPEGGFGIYVHWPFCQSKCPYCDFNSHVRHAAIDEERFIRAFAAEMQWFAERTGKLPVESIFFGGGTPSLMKPETVAGILDAISANWPVRKDAEITLEANPGSVEAARFAGYHAAGINRVSLGVQALNDDDLKLLGRLHTVEEARAALEIARRQFDRFSFDLIHTRPGQTLHAWRAELSEACAMAGGHLSLYQLTIEPDTPFAALHNAGKLEVPSPELAADLYELTQEITERHNMPAYEVSNHAVPGQESRHNLVYWHYGRYAGLGPGAHSRVNIGGQVTGLSSEPHPETWLEQVEEKGVGTILTETLDRSEQADEFLLMGLRLREGIDPDRYTQISGRMLDPGRVEDLLREGMIEHGPQGRLRATQAGFSVLNAVIADLAAEPVGWRGVDGI